MKYFNGTSGVYFEQSNNDLWIIEEVEPASSINKRTWKVETIKRYNLQNYKHKIKKTAVVKNPDLIFIGEL